MEDPEKKEVEEEKKEEETKEEKPGEERKISDKILIWPIVIIIAITLIFVGIKYVLPKEEVLTIDDMHKLNIEGRLPPEQGYLYEDVHSFVNFGGMWYFQVQSGNVLVNVPLRYGPRDVEDITLSGGLDGRFTNATSIYMTFDPLGHDLTYVALAVGELDQSLITAFGNEVIAACDKNETSACKDRPIITCNNTNKAVIYIMESKEPAVNLKGNCVEIKGYDMELLRHVDRLLLEFYGVMKRD